MENLISPKLSLLHSNCKSWQIARVEQFRKFRRLHGLLAVLLLFQVGLTLAMASWSKLHHDLHCDSDHPDHQCEVTLFQSGALDTCPPVVELPDRAPEAALPEATRTVVSATIVASHFRGGMLAQGPPRGP